MSSDISIKVDNLSKSYHIYERPRDRLTQMFCWGRRQYFREFWALKDVSFSVGKGETVGIIGRNGSGKSTLLQLICGTLAQTTGSITTYGRVAALLELGSGFGPDFTGRENVFMNASILGLQPEEIEARFDTIASFADIGEYIDQPVKTYSSGMYVRLAFAVAIHVDPDILIVDEALAVGDVRFQLKCQRKINELREQQKTILLVSHSGADVIRLCNRAIWLDEGCLRGLGDPKRLVEEYSAWMVHDTGVQKIIGSAGTPFLRASEQIRDHLVPVHPDAFCTGEGGACVEAVGLLSEKNHLLTSISGPTTLTVVLRVRIKRPIERPFFAFQIINAKGLRIMGSNTAVLDYPVKPLCAGQVVTVRFTFRFPELENGSYVLGVGVADGTQLDHVRHQFIADAYEFKVVSPSRFQEQAVLLKLTDCIVKCDIQSLEIEPVDEPRHDRLKDTNGRSV